MPIFATAKVSMSCFTVANCRSEHGSDLHLSPLSNTPTSECVHIHPPASDKDCEISVRQV
jgi:hypothetical protein